MPFARTRAPSHAARTPNRAPIARRRPAAKAAALIRRPPAGCSSVITSAPSPQATTMPSPSVASTVPGSAPGVAMRAGCARHSLTVSPRQQRRRAGRGIEGADLAIDARGGRIPVDDRFGLANLRRIGDAFRRLRHRRPDRARREAPQIGDQDASALAPPACARAWPRCRAGRSERERVEHRAGVEPRVHLHERDAGFAHRPRAARAGSAPRRASAAAATRGC